jgi:endo-1,4-beta-xylanase
MTRSTRGGISLPLLALMLAACGGDEAPQPPADGVAVPMPIRLAAERAGLRWGAALAAAPLASDPAYRSLVGEAFNIVTPENAMKFEVLQPEPGVFNFSEADAIADFARAHGQKLRGHVLVWHTQLPDWVTQGHFSRDELIAVMRTHIYTVLGYYRSQYPDVIAEWDVVNESFEADGSRRQSVWQRVIGDDYIDLAFGFASEAWPGLPLYYNDFYENNFVVLGSQIGADGSINPGLRLGVGASPALSDCALIPKCAATRRLVEDLLAAGVPIHGIGLQAHIASAAAPDYARLTDWIAPLGLRWALTELDAPCPLGPIDNTVCFQTQAAIFRSAAQDCIESPACDTIVQWGVNDTYTWWPGISLGLFGEALAFDDAYRPKPAAAALLALFEAYAR